MGMGIWMLLLMVLNIIIAELNIHSDVTWKRYVGGFNYFAAGTCFLSAIHNFM